MYGVSNADFYNEKIGVQGGMIKGIPAVFKCADKEASQTWQMYEATLLFFKDQKASTSERLNFLHFLNFIRNTKQFVSDGFVVKL